MLKFFSQLLHRRMPVTNMHVSNSIHTKNIRYSKKKSKIYLSDCQNIHVHMYTSHMSGFLYKLTIKTNNVEGETMLVLYFFSLDM